jgi:excisionase family DNA binding protein
MSQTQNQEVLTLKEVSEYLRVPEANVRAEVDAGRLPIISIGGEERILKEDILALRQSRRTKCSLNHSKKFSFTWPSGTIEHYDQAHEGVVRVDDGWEAVKIGFTKRKTAGRLRKRAVVFVNRRPRAEFVAADDFEESRLMVSLIKTKGGRQIPPTEYLPREYEKFLVKPYNKYVTGPNSYSNLAVICKDDDLEGMTDLALIRVRNDAFS